MFLAWKSNPHKSIHHNHLSLQPDSCPKHTSLYKILPYYEFSKDPYLFFENLGSSRIHRVIQTPHTWQNQSSNMGAAQVYTQRLLQKDECMPRSDLRSYVLGFVCGFCIPSTFRATLLWTPALALHADFGVLAGGGTPRRRDCGSCTKAAQGESLALAI